MNFIIKICIVFCSAFFSASSLLLANTTKVDSLLLLSDLEFDSEFEKENFFLLNDKGENAFEVLMTIGNERSGKLIAMDKNMFMTEVAKMKQIPIPKKKEKYYKEIYEKTHDRFFRKYELKNYFSDVFTSGQYNCVSASAIYALLFEELNVDFVVKETPTHVYLVAEPTTQQYVIETTDPVGGLNKFSQNFKSNFLKNLMEAKLIEQQEYLSTDADILFDKYYFTEKNLGLKELVAVQYSNQALYKMEESAFDESLKAIKKSYFLYPSDKSYGVLLYGMLKKTMTTKYVEERDFDMIGVLSRFKSSDVSDEVLVGEFGRLTNEVLVEEGEEELYDTYYNETIMSLERDAVKEEVSFVYNHERGRILFNKGYYEESFDFISSAFQLRPKNANVESMFLGALVEIIESETDYKKVVDTLESTLLKYPLLKENNKFGGVYLNAYLLSMSEKYDENKLEDGNWFKDKFENSFENNPRYQVDEGLIGHAYSQLAVYYFKKGHYKSAKSTIYKGLELVPNNSELKARLRMVNY